MTDTNRKRIKVAGHSYELDPSKDFAEVVAEVTEAMESGGVVAVAALDKRGRQLTLHLNGKMLDCVRLYNGAVARPGEVGP